MRRDAEPARRSRWIPWIFVAFFAVVFTANGLLIAFALESWTGFDGADAYRRGVHYNRALAAAAHQNSLGWHSELAFADKGGKAGRIEFVLTDRRNVPVRRADVKAMIVRPTAAGHDFTEPLHESAPGRYAATVAFPLPGQWEVRVLAQSHDAENDRFAAVARIMVAP
ncbi:MAG: FixH family protein [Candidatus Eiseniibacteriota bacterium]